MVFFAGQYTFHYGCFIGPRCVILWYFLQANIHSIMGSEDQVLNLMRLLDGGINQAENIEDKLDSYDKILQVTYFSMRHNQYN